MEVAGMDMSRFEGVALLVAAPLIGLAYAVLVPILGPFLLLASIGSGMIAKVRSA
jgi:hypothetical protein